MTPNQIFEPYAKNIFSLKEEFLNIEKKYNAAVDPWDKALLRKKMGSMKRLIDRCIRETGDFIPAGVSQKAYTYCGNLHPNQPDRIFKTRWVDQPKFEKQPNRSSCKMVHEHKIPVNDIIEKVKRAKSVEEIIEILKSQEIVWITKKEEEDSRLPRKHRPDPNQAYKNAGIVVIKNPNTFGHLFK